MMNEFQRRILAEAAKYGGAAISKNEQMAKAINEAPALAPSAVTSMFGYSKQQFEMKMRQLIQKMGFEKGINKMEVADKKMVLYFANAAKARDFIITFNGLTKRQSKGSPASISTSFDKVKAPAGTNAIVTVDFTMLKTEGMDRESHLFLMLESLHEQYITEGAMKAAIEDFMYSIPDAAIKDLKPVMKITNISRRFSEITKVLRKHGFPTMSKTLGSNSSNIINDYYDTFFGESVEGDMEEIVSEGVRMMAGAEKMVKDDPAGGSSMISSLRNIKKSLEGKPTGSVMVVTKEKNPESMSINVYDPSAFASFTKGFSKKPEAKVGSKGTWSGGEVTVIAIKEEVEVAEDFKAGDKVKVPHKGKMVSGKIVRFDDGGTSKAQQHGGGYVIDVGEPASILVPKQKVQKEETEVSEAKVKYLTGQGKRDPKRIIGIYNMQGKWIKDMNSEREAMTFVNKSWGESVEEEVELDEVSMMRKLGRIVGTVTGAAGNKWKDMKADYESWRKVREQIKQAKKDLESVKKEIATADAARDVRAWGKIKELNAQLERLKNEEKERKERLAQATKEEVELDEEITPARQAIIDREKEKASKALNKGKTAAERDRGYARGSRINYLELVYKYGRKSDTQGSPYQVNKREMNKWRKAEQGMKEEIEQVDEAKGKVKYLTGPGKKDSKRIIGIYTMGGKWVKDMGTEKEAANFVNKSWGEEVEQVDEAKPLVGGQKKLDVNKNGKLDAHDFKALRAKKEETEVTEAMNNYIAFYNGKKMTVQAETSYKAQLKAIEMFKAPASKKHMVTVKLAN
jgi:hypothetical protein